MQFSYVAIDKNNQRILGQLEAESVKAAADMLRGQNMLPINIQLGIKTKKKGLDVKNIFGRVTLQEKINFIQNFTVMLRSGFSVSRALTVLTEQEENTTFKAALQSIGNGVESGLSLSEAMSKYPRIFSSMFTNVVKVGESSGNLDQSLLNLSQQLKKDNDIIKKTKGAMIYPAVVLTAMLIIAVCMFTFVLPKLTAMFEDFDVKLPLVTRILIGIVNFMKHNGLYVLGAIVVAGFSLMYFSRQPAGQAFMDKVSIRIPAIGKLIKYTNLARFSRTLSSLLKAGMPILESVKITGDSLGNNEYRIALARAENLVRGGAQLSGALRNYPNLFPGLLVNMISVGEESGNVDSTLEEVAGFYEAEVDQAVSNLSSILEPVLMLIVGAGVGVIAMGLIMPIYSITQNI